MPWYSYKLEGWQIAVDALNEGMLPNTSNSKLPEQFIKGA